MFWNCFQSEIERACVKKMRKPVLPRILGLLCLYCVVFIALVMIQFTKKGNFTRRIGGMVVSGQYALSDENGEKADFENSAESPESVEPREKPLSLAGGGASVYFGGLEFNLRNRNSNLALIGADERRRAAIAESLSFSGDAAIFSLSGGTELIFRTQAADDVPELWIGGTFASGVSGIEIPVKPQRSSLLHETSEGNISITHNGSAYQFSRPVQFRERAVLSLQEDTVSVSYRAIHEQKAFNPADFIIANARSRQVFNEAIMRWRDQRFSYWRGNISTQADEDTVSAYCGEAVNRGNYQQAVASVPAAFLNSSQRGYESSVFIGGMSAARQNFIQAERDAISRISRIINEKSPDLLTESHAFEFLLLRGYLNYADEGLEMIHSMDAASLTYEMCPGIFEGYTAIRQFRSHGDNPFERLTDQACNIFSSGIRKDAEREQVFVFRENAADIEYNLRLGRALSAWAVAVGRDDWANLGRSLILSALSLQDNEGAVPASVTISEAGKFSGATGSGLNAERLSAARVYKIIMPGEHYPHAAVIGSGVNGLWTWTTAPLVSATQENNVLDIAASFPTGETHHMMIRGVRPFSKIQIYNMDYPTDPQFERYDSSGWVYSSQEQILTVKMKHREPMEHVRIFY